MNIDGRFPRGADVTFLLYNGKRLPAAEDFNQPVTQDLNGEVVVRIKGDDAQPATELALVNSTRSGDVTATAVVGSGRGE